MCLYPTIRRNQKYQKNGKNGGIIPPVYDTRVLHVPTGCGQCMECRKQKAREWTARLMEEIKTNKNGIFVTLTISDEKIAEIVDKGWIHTKDRTRDVIWKTNIKDTKGYEKDNAIATWAVRHFLERWRKEHKESPRHWLVTELGHKGTKNVHLHGIIWTDKAHTEIVKHWQYGFVWDGYTKNGKRINYVNNETVNYTVKYIHKIDKEHRYYKSKILASHKPGIGSNYKGKENKYKGEETKETYRTGSGHKIALPTYWRNKIYTDEEKEKLWVNKLNKEERWVNGIRVSIQNGNEEYFELLKQEREKNKRLGYGNDRTNWKRKVYEEQIREILIETRIQRAERKKE